MSVVPATTPALATRSGNRAAQATTYGPPDDSPMTPKRSTPSWPTSAVTPAGQSFQPRPGAPAPAHRPPPAFQPHPSAERRSIRLQTTDLVVTALRGEPVHHRAPISAALVLRQRRDRVDVRGLQDGLAFRLDPSRRDDR